MIDLLYVYGEPIDRTSSAMIFTAENKTEMSGWFRNAVVIQPSPYSTIYPSVHQASVSVMLNAGMRVLVRSAPMSLFNDIDLRAILEEYATHPGLGNIGSILVHHTPGFVVMPNDDHHPPITRSDGTATATTERGFGIDATVPQLVREWRGERFVDENTYRNDPRYRYPARINAIRTEGTIHV